MIFRLTQAICKITCKDQKPALETELLIFNMEGVKLNLSSLWQNAWNAIEVNSLGFLAEDAKYWIVTDMS